MDKFTTERNTVPDYRYFWSCRQTMHADYFVRTLYCKASEIDFVGNKRIACNTH